MRPYLLGLVFLLMFTSATHGGDNTGRMLVVGSEQDYPPFAVGQTDENADGFTVELWKTVAKEAGLNYSLQVKPFRQILQEFKDGRIDVLINLAQSDERRQFADFTVPHVTVNGAIFVRDGETGIRTEADLKGKSIIVLNADLANDYAISKGWQKQLVRVDTGAAGFKLLASGRHDALLISKLTGMQTLRALNLSGIHALPVKAGFSQKFSFAVHKNQAVLLADLNEGLALTKAGGVYDRLYEKWFGIFEEKAPSLQDTFKILGPIAGAVLGLAGFFLYRRRKERKHAESLLRESEDRLRTLFDTSPECIKLIDINGMLLDMNAAGLTMVEADAAGAVIGRSVLNLIATEHRADFLQLTRRICQGQKGRLEFEIIGLKGTRRWMETHAVPFTNRKNGERVQLAISRDITERKQTELALQQSEAKFRAIINASPVPFALNDSQQHIVFLNAAFINTFGYTLKDIPTLADWWPKAYPDPDYRQWVKANWQARLDKTAFEGRGFEPIELKIRCKDGGFRTVMANASELGAKFEGTYLVILHDITEQIAAMASLADSHTLLQTVIDTLPLRVFWKDTDSRYLGCNTAFAKDSGAENAQDIIGKVDSQLAWREQAELYIADDRRVINSNLARLAYEEPQTTPDGKTIWLRTSKVALHNADNKTIGVVGVYENITERKQLELREQCYTQVLEQLSNGAPLPEILEIITCNVAQNNPALRCSILLADHDDKHRPPSITPTTDIDNSGQDSCPQPGRDRGVLTEPDSSWSEPIMSTSGKAFGTITLHHGALTPTPHDLKQLEHAAHLAALAIEKSNNREALQLASLVYENSSEAIMISDANNTIIAHNPAFTKLSGYTQAEVIGKKTSILKSGHHDEAFYHVLWNTLNATGHWQGEIWNKRKNGEIYPEWLTINTIYNQDGTIHRRVALLSDISQKKQSEQIIWQQANFDPLTTLPNRRMFHDRLAQEIKKAHRSGLPLALMFLDLDHFKEINDTLGHNTGDLLLKETAHRITACVRETDTVARLGGDEFTVILSEINDTSCIERIARSIVKKLAEPFQLNNETAYVSVSIGITLYPNDAHTIEDLLKHADQAMYASKNEGRNCYNYFTPSMQEAAQNRMRLTNDLRSALAGQQFHLVYQPIVELATGAINKAEALIRWDHPLRGLISPAEFIPIAEETGLIVEIGDWVFREAARQTAYWRTSHHKQFQISVNKSPIQFRGNNSHFEWFDYLQKLGLPGQSIVVEITEGLLLDAGAGISKQLLEFRDAGIQVALDDFGTGYSSLSYLKKFDIDYLKIDQSFVRNLAPHSDDMALCEAIIVMAHKLGIKVIAEGIETAKQCELLSAAGCDYGQGYLFSKPVPADEFEELLNPPPRVFNADSGKHTLKIKQPS